MKAGRPAAIKINVIDNQTGEMIIKDATMRDVAKALGSTPQRVSRAKIKGGLLLWRYRIIALEAQENTMNEEKLDDYAIEWEIQELCRKFRTQIEPSKLRKIPIIQKEAV